MQAARWLLEKLSFSDGRAAHLRCDSRQIEPGDVFFAYPGEQRDGRDFMAVAIGRGAAALVVEAQGFDSAVNYAGPVLAVSQLKQFAGAIAAGALPESLAPFHQRRFDVSQAA